MTADFAPLDAQWVINAFIEKTTIWEKPGTYWWDDFVNANGVIDTGFLDDLDYTTEAQKLLQDNVKYLKRAWDVRLASTTIKEEIKFDRDLLRGYCQSDYPRFSITIESDDRDEELTYFQPDSHDELVDYIEDDLYCEILDWVRDWEVIGRVVVKLQWDYEAHMAPIQSTTIDTLYEGYVGKWSDGNIKITDEPDEDEPVCCKCGTDDETAVEQCHKCEKYMCVDCDEGEMGTYDVDGHTYCYDCHPVDDNEPDASNP